MSEIDSITKWISTANQKRDTKGVAAYLGHTLSELAEGLEAIHDEDCRQVAYMMQALSMRLRKGELNNKVEHASKVELMDSAIDTMWTAVGMAHMLGSAQGAFSEVCRSNYSKFVNGVATLDTTGKVVKPSTYFAPNLKPFVRKV